MGKSKVKVIYYRDELNDEFSEARIEARRIDGNYEYCRDSLFRRFTAFFWYRIVAVPAAFCFLKAVWRHRIVGREKLRPFRKKGLFIYGNHTHPLCNTCIPAMLCFPQRVYLVCSAANVSIPHIGLAAASLGALPLPEGKEAYKNFRAAIERRIGEGCAVAIYPEAHIWPYYTGIRPFTDVSFAYPVSLNTPAFCFTDTYQKRRFSGRPRIVTYVDGPFYPPEGVSARDARAALRNEVYNAMCERAKNSNHVQIEYIRREEQND